MPYGTDPPATYFSITAGKISVPTLDYINMSKSFWAISVYGICLCITHIISAIFHFIRPLHKIAKPFQLLNHLVTLPFLIAATVWRFCEGGIVCANATNITYYNLSLAETLVA